MYKVDPASSGSVLVPVMHRDALGYPEHESRGGYDVAQYVPLLEALTVDSDFDAHFCQYSLPETPRRLAGSRALELGAVMVLVVFDVDGPDHAFTQEWWSSEKVKLEKLLTAIPGGYVFTTRGGYRIVYRTASPLVLESRRDAVRWRASYLEWADALETSLGIVVDKNCADVFRLFRLPRVTREGALQVPETIGDPGSVGAWSEPYVDSITPASRERSPDRVPAPGSDQRTKAAQLLGEHWPDERRHYAHLALSGALAHAGWDVEDIAEFCEEVAEVQEPGNGKFHKRLKTAREGVSRVSSELETQGWTTLEREFVSVEIVTAVKKLLGFLVLEDDPGFLEWVQSKVPTPPPPEPPNTIELEADLKAFRDKLAKKKDSDSKRDAEYLKRVIKGQFLVDDPGEDLDRAVSLAACVVVRAAREGTTTDQFIKQLTGSAGRLAQSLPEIITHAVEAVKQEKAQLANRPLDEFKLEISGQRVGMPIATHQHNHDVALARLGSEFSYNLFNAKKYLKIDGKESIVEDADIDAISFRIEKEFGFYPPPDKFYKYCTYLARQNAYHPVVDYLDSCPAWDGVPRAEEWLIKFGGAEDTLYVRAVSRLVLVAAVRRVRKPGCKFDEMLILEGEQGAFKSSALQTLCPKREWFTDNFRLSDDTKKMLEQTDGKWIVEAGELKGMSAKDRNELKAYLSSTEDEARMSYQREPVRRPRQFIIIGTTNEAHYLVDPTGDRRYWPVAVSKFDIEALEGARDQLWAEASYLEAVNSDASYIRLDPSLYAAAAFEQDKRKVDDPYRITFEQVIGDATGRILVTEVWKLIGKTGDNLPTSAEARQVTAAMRSLGFEKKRITIGKDRSWYYQKGTGDAVLQVVGSSGTSWKVKLATSTGTATNVVIPRPSGNN